MINKAYQIAIESLRRCYDKEGIVAGRTHFNYYWARDSFYASWGSLELKDYAIVKTTLESFLRNVDKKGVVPIRIGSSTVAQCLALLGLMQKSNLKPYYNHDKGFSEAIDPNLLLLITLQRYAEKTDDKAIIKNNASKIDLIIHWLEKQERQGLIYGNNYSTWQDMIKKRGFALYTNVLYYEALRCVSKTLKRIGSKNKFLEKAIAIREKINEKFWDNKLGHYIDYYNDDRRSAVFSSDGNFFAILFNVADKKQSESILEKAEKIGISKDVPSYTNYPAYGFPEVFTPFYLLGMQDYNDYGVCWTWLGALHSAALFKAGKKNKAKIVLEKLSGFIIKDKDVYETYEKSGEPLKRFFYKSEHPFAWSAGFYIKAAKFFSKSEIKK